MIDTNSLRVLLQAATPGPWHVSRIIGDGDQVCYGDAFVGADEYGVAYCESMAGDDAPLVVALRNSAEELLDALDAERGKVETLRTLLAEAREFVNDYENPYPAAVALVSRIDTALIPPVDPDDPKAA